MSEVMNPVSERNYVTTKNLRAVNGELVWVEEPELFDSEAIRTLMNHLESHGGFESYELSDTVCGLGSFALVTDELVYVVREFPQTTWTSGYTVEVYSEMTEALWSEYTEYMDELEDE